MAATNEISSGPAAARSAIANENGLARRRARGDVRDQEVSHDPTGRQPTHISRLSDLQFGPYRTVVRTRVREDHARHRPHRAPHQNVVDLAVRVARWASCDRSRPGASRA